MRKKHMVIGVGNCGTKILENVIKEKSSDLTVLAIDSDPDNLVRFEEDQSLLVEEQELEITEQLQGVEQLVIICGLGGGTGTDVTPAIAKCAKHLGIPTIGMLITPFRFETVTCREKAKAGEAIIREVVDQIVMVSNDILLDEEEAREEAKKGLTKGWEYLNKRIGREVLDLVA